MSFLFLVLIVGLAAFWLIRAYNSLINLKNQVVNAWQQIDVQLRRRHDLIPNLVETVKGAMQFERDTLDAVITARNQAVAVERGSASVVRTAEVESQLSSALSRLMVVVEAYPDLKATGNVARLQEELTSTENKISFARQLYNDTATLYNTTQAQFPTKLVAGLATATPVDLWEITDPAERALPKVNLSLNSADRSRV
jgi:LemA protein